MMLSASAFSSRSCCVMSEPGGGEGGGVGDRVLDRLGVRRRERRWTPNSPLSFSLLPGKSEERRAWRARDLSPALRPHEIFMQGIGAARDERIRVASATRDEALGVLTRKPPPYTRRTSSSAFSRTARLIDTLVFGVFETLQCATALPHPSLPTPRDMSAVPCASFASAWTRVRARRPPSRRPARVYPERSDWKPPEENPPTRHGGIPALVATARFVVPRAGDLRAAAGGAGPPRIGGDPLRPYEPRPTRDLPPPVSDPERTEDRRNQQNRRKFRSLWWRRAGAGAEPRAPRPARVAPAGGDERPARARRGSGRGGNVGERRRRGVAPAGLSRRRRCVPRNERERPTLKRFGDAAA